MITFTFERGKKYVEVFDRELPYVEVIMHDGELSCSQIILTDKPERVEDQYLRTKQTDKTRLAVLGGRVVPLYLTLARPRK